MVKNTQFWAKGGMAHLPPPRIRHCECLLRIKYTAYFGITNTFRNIHILLRLSNNYDKIVVSLSSALGKYTSHVADRQPLPSCQFNFSHPNSECRQLSRSHAAKRTMHSYCILINKHVTCKQRSAFSRRPLNSGSSV